MNLTNTITAAATVAALATAAQAGCIGPEIMGVCHGTTTGGSGQITDPYNGSVIGNIQPNGIITDPYNGSTVVTMQGY